MGEIAPQSNKEEEEEQRRWGIFIGRSKKAKLK
jgi:hypothetical protein